MKSAGYAADRPSRAKKPWKHMQRNCVLFAFLAIGCTGVRTSLDSGSVVPSPDAGALDPYAALDPRPFGMLPAIIHLPWRWGDRYLPAKEAQVAWTRGANSPALTWDFADPNRTGDPARMRFVTSAPQPPGSTGNMDEAIADALASGIHVMWSIGVEWEPSNGGFTKQGSWLPVDEGAYQTFVETAVARYPSVRVWQVGNEPNLLPENSERTDYARMHRLTYEAIKRANPRAIVLLAGPSGGMSAPGLKVPHFESVLTELNGCCVDVFDFHFYGDAKGGRLRSGDGNRMLGYAEFAEAAAYYRQQLDTRGFRHTHLWSTENGTPSGTWLEPPQQRLTVTEAEQARDLPKRWMVGLAAGVEKIFWAWGMVEGFHMDDTFFDHTGLIYGDGVPSPGNPGPNANSGERKLSYWAYWQMTRQLEGCQWTQVARLQTSIPNTRAYRCPRVGGGEIVVAWWDTFLEPGYLSGQTIQLTLPWAASTAVARMAVPPVPSGADVTNPAVAFPVTPVAVSGGMATLTLGAEPVYVRAE